MVTRRDVLVGGGSIALFSPAIFKGCADSLVKPTDDQLPGSAWSALARKMRNHGKSHGTVVLPKHPSYSALALPRNISYAHIRPQGVAVCCDEKNVQTAVKWAVGHSISPVPRSPGAHSYAGYSATNGLSLDLSAMKGVQIDEREGTATIGAGAMLGDVSNALSAKGYFLPIGRCFSVGVTGLTLSGGFGFNARPFGLTSDSLIESEIVTADGERVVCNETQNSDLFWALRGGNGGTFGVNTSFKFALQRGAASIQVFRLSSRFDLNEKEAIARAWAALQATATNAPNEFSIRIGVDCDPCKEIMLEGLGQFYGSRDDLLDILKPALQPAPAELFIEELDFASAGRYLLSVGAPNAFYTKSAFIDNDLSDASISAVLTWFDELPCSAKSGSFTMFRWGGAIENKAPEDTAFVHRSGQYVVEGTVRWRPGNSRRLINNAKHWLHTGFTKKIHAQFNGSAFQSFIDRDQTNWEQAYYGSNFSKLKEVKRRWDATDVFRNSQSIPIT